jgi:hypothetical protein
MGADFERERQDYFDRISGVGEWQGMRFGWSRWAWDVAWHPAMLKGRSGHQPRRSRWDPLKPLLFLVVVFGIPALAILLAPGSISSGTKLMIVFAVVGGGLWIAIVAAHARVWRAHTNAPKPFPHPGPKGRHRHR